MEVQAFYNCKTYEELLGYMHKMETDMVQDAMPEIIKTVNSRLPSDNPNGILMECINEKLVEVRRDLEKVLDFLQEAEDYVAEHNLAPGTEFVMGTVRLVARAPLA